MTDLKWKRVGGVVYAGIKPFKGRMKWVSMRTTDMAEARRLAKEAKLFKLQAVESVNALTDQVISSIRTDESPTVSEAINLYIESLVTTGRPNGTVSRFRSCLMQWMRLSGVGGNRASSIAQDQFTSFFNPCDGTKLKTLTIRQLACNKFCDYLADRAWLRGNPARGVGIDLTKLTQEDKLVTSHKPITKDEFTRLITRAAEMENPFLYFALLFGWEHGLRLGDICCMEMVNIVDNELRLMTGKTGTVVRLPLTNAVVAALAKKAPPEAEHEKQFLFPKERAQYNLYGASSFGPSFKKLCRLAGVDGKTFHCLRTSYINRTFSEKQDSIIRQMATELAKQQTASNAGHRTTAATDIYLAAGGGATRGISSG